MHVKSCICEKCDLCVHCIGTGADRLLKWKPKFLNYFIHLMAACFYGVAILLHLVPWLQFGTNLMITRILHALVLLAKLCCQFLSL